MEKVYARVINLDTRTDRWDAMRRRLGPLSIERFSAIRPTDNDLKHLSFRAALEFGRERKHHWALTTRGALGCTLSHLHIWKNFLQSDKQVALILEDDADVHADDLQNAVADALQTAHLHWDLFLLGWVGHLPGDASGVVRPLPRSEGFWGSHAYLVTRKAASKLIDDALPIEVQLDAYLQLCAEKHSLTIRAGRTKIKQVWKNDSDILSICLLCNSRYVYAAFCALLAILVFLVGR